MFKDYSRYIISFKLARNLEFCSGFWYPVGMKSPHNRDLKKPAVPGPNSGSSVPSITLSPGSGKQWLLQGESRSVLGAANTASLMQPSAAEGIPQLNQHVRFQLSLPDNEA